MSNPILATADISSNGDGEPQIVREVVPDQFDPAELRLSQDFGNSIGVKKVLTVVRCDKPNRHEFVRVHPGEDWRLETGVV